MTRRLPLGVWLALGFALAVAAPALSAGAAWWAVGARQQADVDARVHQATARIEQAGSRLDDTRTWKSVAGALADLRVEADLQLSPPKELATGKPGTTELAPAGVTTKRVVVAGETGPFVTDGLAAALERPDGKRALTRRWESHDLQNGALAGTLFVERPSRANTLFLSQKAPPYRRRGLCREQARERDRDRR